MQQILVKCTLVLCLRHVCSGVDLVKSLFMLVALTCTEAWFIRWIPTVISRVTVTVERHTATVIAGELGAAAGWRGGSDQHDGQDSNQQSDHSHRQTWNKRPQYRTHPDSQFNVWFIRRGSDKRMSDIRQDEVIWSTMPEFTWKTEYHHEALQNNLCPCRNSNRTPCWIEVRNLTGWAISSGHSFKLRNSTLRM